MGILKLPQLLLIAGNGRNSGKTTLACLIIQKFSKDHRITALKISPHKHRIVTGGVIISDGDNFFIAEETDAGTGKDSSRMLLAGASRSFFICSDEDHLPLALNKILELADDNSMIVCESGGLRRIAEPGLFIIVDRIGSEAIKQGTQNLMQYENIWLTFDGYHFNLNWNEIVIHHNSWEKITDYDFI